MRKIARIEYAIVLIIIIFTPHIIFADSIIMKDKRIVKGLVVDEYVDRITLSTVDGEIDIDRKEIERIEYDAPEQSYLQLGRAYESKGFYEKAASYYRKAVDANPNLKEAQEALVAAGDKVRRGREKKGQREIEILSMATEWRKTGYKKDVSATAKKEAQLKEALGLSLAQKEGIFMIGEVEPNSGASETNIKTGDFLVAISGRLIRYDKMEDVLGELLGPKYSEVNLTVEKDISISDESASAESAGRGLYKSLGITLEFTYENLEIEEASEGGLGEKAGLKKGDAVIAINGQSTRYLPLEGAINIINDSKGKKVVFTIRRNLTLRRGGETNVSQ